MAQTQSFGGICRGLLHTAALPPLPFPVLEKLSKEVLSPWETGEGCPSPAGIPAPGQAVGG